MAAGNQWTVYIQRSRSRRHPGAIEVGKQGSRDPAERRMERLDVILSLIEELQTGDDVAWLVGYRTKLMVRKDDPRYCKDAQKGSKQTQKRRSLGCGKMGEREHCRRDTARVGLRFPLGKAFRRLSGFLLTLERQG